jgi:hypothetical protein
MEKESLESGLRRIRRRRCYLWMIAAAYLPLMGMTMALTHSNRALIAVYCIWVVFLAKAVLPVAFVLCPRCGKRFHMKGFFPRYGRKCVHCGIHINADKELPSSQ